MPFARNGKVRLFYECIGQRSDPAVLLLAGAGKQAIDFAEPFCAALVERGFHVIRFDQRDTGYSTDFSKVAPDAAGTAAAVAAGRTPTLPYTAADLAADAIAVLDASEVGQAHLFGRSLGSLIAQIVALEAPERVLSLTLAMPFSRAIGGGMAPERLAALDRETWPDAASFAVRQVETSRAVGNPAWFDEARICAEALAAYDRGVHAGAVARHFMVGLAAPDLRQRLATLSRPVQLIAGRLDKIISLALSEEVAAAIPGARLTIFDDMAHEGPPQLWDRWIDLFVANAERATEPLET